MRCLPVELVEYIFDLLLKPATFDANVALSLCRVDRRTYRSVVRRLYHAPRLDRHHVHKFVRAAKDDNEAVQPIITTLSDEIISRRPITKQAISLRQIRGAALVNFVQHIAFIGAPAPTTKTCFQVDHEHVSGHDVVACLKLIAETVESIALDMTCTHMACSWQADDDDRISPHAKLHLPKLRTLTCRCPRGYLPYKTEKLMVSLRLGLRPSLRNLNLVWTAPGPYRAPGLMASLDRIIRNMPNLVLLRVITAKQKTIGRVPTLLLEQVPIEKHQCVMRNQQELMDLDDQSIQQVDGLAMFTAVSEQEASTPYSFFSSNLEHRRIASELTSHDNDLPVQDIACTLARCGRSKVTQTNTSISLQIGHIYMPKQRRLNARPFCETLRQVGGDLGWSAFLTLQPSLAVPSAESDWEDCTENGYRIL